MVGDEPVNWLSHNNLSAADAPTPAADGGSSIGGSPSASLVALPASLAQFVAWRTGREAPDANWSGDAISASGPADAALMVLVDCPERGDRDRLLGGETGKLFDNMLRAIGLAREEVLLASVCVRRPTIGRVPRDLEQRLGEVTRHHLSLTMPGNLLVLGDAATRAVLATNVALSLIHI